MQEVKARGGKLIVVTDADERELNGLADHIILVPSASTYSLSTINSRSLAVACLSYCGIARL